MTREEKVEALALAGGVSSGTADALLNMIERLREIEAEEEARVEHARFMKRIRPFASFAERVHGRTR